jgi:hypothetical protein
MGSVTRSRQRSYDNQATGGQHGQPIAHKMTQLALHPGTYDSTAHGLAHDETRTRRGNSPPRCVRVFFTATDMDDQKRATGSASSAYRDRELFAPPQPMLGRQHVMTCARSGGQTGATLATAGREDRAAGTGTHTQPEPVGLGATAVVRLEGALAHSGAPEMIGDGGTSPGCHRAPTSSSSRSRPSAPLHNHKPVIFAHRRQAAAAIDNSTWSRYAALRHPVKPAVCARATVHSLWTVT